MSIISQETWDNMPKEEKEEIIKRYIQLNKDIKNVSSDYLKKWTKGQISELEQLFGKENLRPNKIKTWADIEKLLPEDGFCVGNFEKFADNPKVILKCQATLKIAKLIELGYGGMVTEEEWKNNHIVKFCVIADYSSKYKSLNCETDDDYHFIAFHTSRQRGEFMSYPENRELVKHYYMMPNE